MGEDRASQVALVVKSPPANAGNIKDLGLSPRVGKIPWRRAWQPTPVFMPGKSQGQRNLVNYSPWGCKRVGHDSATKQQQHNQTSDFFEFVLNMIT